ncbi:hypothetical protein JCM16814_29720 [Desulfobaculum senezii]
MSQNLFRKKHILLKQFISTLNATYRDFSYKPDDQVSWNGENPDEGWDIAYKAELELASLLTPTHLDEEFKRRLAEGKSSLPSELVQFYQQSSTEKMDVREKRSHYFRLLNDLQWSAQRREAAWEKLQHGTAMIALAMGVAIFSFFVLLHCYSPVYGDSVGTEKQVCQWALVGIVGVSGVLGAIFSLLIRLYGAFDTTKIRELENFASISFISTRLGIGMLAALFAYFLLAAEIVSFPFIPTCDGTDPIHSPFIVISILAGFFENMIPNIMKKATRDN